MTIKPGSYMSAGNPAGKNHSYSKGVGMKKGAKSKRRVSFSITSPLAQVVSVAGSFNDWHPEKDPLKRDKHGN
jgi:1,4-alpha-glucan branching enzyme